MSDQQTPAALITGATSGIGAAFARRFANQGYNLIITGRREEKIQSLANELSTGKGINVEVSITELSNERDLEALVAKVRGARNLEILVNNAGFARRNNFHEEDPSFYEDMVKVHNWAMVRLTHAALPEMIANGRGTIINVSSMMAFTPLPKNAVYSGTKAFINSFTESIHLELLETGVRVQALCPGMTRTDFHEKMGLNPERVYKGRGLLKAMDPEEVVETSFRYLEKGKVICVPGFNNRIIGLLSRILPRPIVYKMALSILDSSRMQAMDKSPTENLS